MSADYRDNEIAHKLYYGSNYPIIKLLKPSFNLQFNQVATLCFKSIECAGAYSLLFGIDATIEINDTKADESKRTGKASACLIQEVGFVYDIYLTENHNYKKINSNIYLLYDNVSLTQYSSVFFKNKLESEGWEFTLKKSSF